MKRSKLTAAMILSALATTTSLAHTGSVNADEKPKGFVIQSVGSDNGRTVSRSESSFDKRTWNSQVNDGEHVYELRMEDGTIVHARIDGKDLSQDRITKRGSVVVFLDENGKTLYEFRTAPESRTWFVRGPEEIEIETPITVSGDQIQVSAVVSRPKTMLGIFQTEVPEAVSEHLGIEGNAIMIESVIEGLPAAKSGLRAKDIIISIDGSDGVTGSELTEILSAHEPGDEITLKVIRKGDKKTIEVELESYDSGALGITQSIGVIEAPEAPQAPGLPITGMWIGEQGRALRERALVEIERSLHESGLSDEQVIRVEGAVRESLKELEESVREAFEAGGNSTRRIGVIGRDLRSEVRDEIMEKLRGAGLAEDEADDVDRVVRESIQVLEESVREASEAMEERLARFPQRESDEQRVLIEEMKRKAEAAMRQAERQIIEFRDGRLTLRNQAEDIEREFFELAKQLEGRSAGMTQELDSRLDALEDRLDELDDRLDRILDMFEGFADRIAERLEDDDD